jgi:Superinfection immunity protein
MPHLFGFLQTSASAAVLVGFLALGVISYFLPWIIASHRAHPNKYPIIVINIFLGWTLVGWVVALAWSCSHIERQAQALAHENQFSDLRPLK